MEAELKEYQLQVFLGLPFGEFANPIKLTYDRLLRSLSQLKLPSKQTPKTQSW
jgi:hypothetical protein